MQGTKDTQQQTDSNAVLELAVYTTIGHREEQQDSFGYALRPHEGLVVVCDGMGGHEGGKMASNLAVSRFLEAYEAQSPGQDAVSFLSETTMQASKAINACTFPNGEPCNAGSTLVAVLLQGRRLFWSSVGDSRAYLLRDREYAQFTLDHNYNTVLLEKLEAGLISQQDFARESQRAEALISYLGIADLQLIDYNNEELLLQPGDKVVIMTDGLYKVVNEAEIFQVISNFSNISEALQALEIKARKNARNANNRDNMTVAIIAVK